MIHSSNPTCSVVVPTYNRAEPLATLLRVLEELVNRAAAEGMNIEVVVVDDGSTDTTPHVMEAFDWIVACHQPNAGPAAARNLGWRTATGEVIVFIDDDCIPAGAWPRQILGAFDDPMVGGAGGNIASAGDGPLDHFVTVERLVDHGRDLGNTLDYLITANAAYRRAALEEVGGFDSSFRRAAGEDVDLAWRLRACGWRLVRAPDTVEHDHRSSVTGILRTFRAHGRARALLDQRHPQQGITASASNAARPSMLMDRWRRYRALGMTAGWIVPLFALRVAGLGTYLVGFLAARWNIPGGPTDPP